MDSIRSICAEQPQRVRKLFEDIDLSRPELKAVREATGRNDWPAACRELLAEMDRRASDQWAKLAQEGTGELHVDPDKLLEDVFTFQYAEDRVPRLPNGRLD